MLELCAMNFWIRKYVGSQSKSSCSSAEPFCCSGWLTASDGLGTCLMVSWAWTCF
jgi:hypothetical protein